LLGREVTSDVPVSGRRQLTLDDGSVVQTDVIVEAIGAIPETEWLEGNGLDLSDGVLCDAQLRVIGATGVVACGDVARWPNLRVDELPRRVEQWTVAGESGRAAGVALAAVLAETEPPEFTPL